MVRKFCLILAILIVCLFFTSKAWSAPCSPEGENIDSLYDVVIYSNGCDLEGYWQCVEFAKRFYFQYHHFNVVGNWSGDGGTYHDKLGLIKYENEHAIELPRLGDTLSFEIGSTGHVAIVSSVNEIDQEITFYQQNWSNKVATQWSTGTVTYEKDPETNQIKINNYSGCAVLGWGRPKYTVPIFSRDGNEYNAVYGVINQPIYAQLDVINSDDCFITIDHVGIGGRGPSGEVADIGINDNYTIDSNSEVNIIKNKIFDKSGDYRFFAYVQKDGNSLLDNVVNRELIFTILNNTNSVIVDDSEINSKFFCRDPIGIRNIGYVSDPEHWNLKSVGYLYGSILVDSDSQCFAQWKPNIKGKHAIEVFIPGNGCNAIVKYKIRPDGTDDNLILSKKINQDTYINQWCPLEDEKGNTSWEFTSDGYISLVADFQTGATVGLDAIKFEPSNVDVALIIDSSGSMTWNDPQDLRKEAARIFIDTAQDDDQIAIVDFDSYSQTHWPLQPLTKNRNDVKSAVNLINSWGGTSLSAGLLEGYDQLDSSTQPYKKAAVFLTDGMGDYNNEAELYKNDGEGNDNDCWPIYTIGLGNSTNPELLKEIADITGGKYFALTNPNHLQKVYFEIAAQISGGNVIASESSVMSTGDAFSALVTIPAGQLSATFLTTWPGSDVNTTLVSPNGIEITSATDDPNIYYAKGLTYELYRATNPEPGGWTINLYGVDLAPQGEMVNISVSSVGPSAPQDTTPPVIIISNPIDGKTYFNQLPTSFNFVVEDPESAITSQTAILNNDPINNNDNILLTQLGENTLTITATNEANLTRELSIIFYVNHFTWLPPIKYEKGSATQTITYIARANSTLPIKFAIFNADDSFIADNSVKVVVEGTTAHFLNGEGDTNIRINQEEGEDPLYIVNLHTNFNKCDYGLEAGNEYNLSVYFNDILAARTKLRIE